MYAFKRTIPTILLISIVILYLHSQNIDLLPWWFSIENSPIIMSNHCSDYGFDDHPTNELPIYDFFIFNNELVDYVHLFLIAESNRTFSGKMKSLYLKENWSRFQRYHHKIRQIEIPLSNLINTSRTAWDNERLMRDEGIRLFLSNSTQ
jgi:Glycosyltransferase family 17